MNVLFLNVDFIAMVVEMSFFSGIQIFNAFIIQMRVG